MTTTTYKGYKIVTVGISRYIYRPENSAMYGDGLTQSMAAAKRWINEDIKEQNTKRIAQNVVVWSGLRTN